MKNIVFAFFIIAAMQLVAFAQVKITPGAPPGTINSTTNVTNQTTNVTNNTATVVTNPTQIIVVTQSSGLASGSGLSSTTATFAALQLKSAATNSLRQPCNALRRTNCQ